ncbi:MAG: hypothetical protein EOR41_13755 [Mesorhizobium sp.]|uniref:transposase n=1 Tax=Mesorhizobium sp. TaxID=1871066 RepID=UPI000FE43E26|nr:transposase [Mesorhizobium sp.]RWK18231.1 MAG: hypothetical protein EOR41_13755 [Mesorhizobium sp.]
MKLIPSGTARDDDTEGAEELALSISMSAPMSDDRSFHVLEAVPNRLEVSRQRPRRRWSAQAKARLLEATLKPDANVSAIACEAGLATSQLFGWRRKAIKSGAVTPQRDADRLGFVEVTHAASSTVEIRVVRDRITIRIVWRGGELTEREVEPRVHALSALSRGAEMEVRLLELAHQGLDDTAIAARLTKEGFRSPRRSYVPVRTVQVVRQGHRVLSQSTPARSHHIPGWLSVSELAMAADVSRSWIRHRIRNGVISIHQSAPCRVASLGRSDTTSMVVSRVVGEQLHSVKEQGAIHPPMGSDSPTGLEAVAVGPPVHGIKQIVTSAPRRNSYTGDRARITTKQ